MIAILLISFLLTTTVQLFFWLFIFGRLARYQSPERAEKPPEPVSVVICARNEAENLRRHLPHFLNQNYRSFEIVVVDDNSTDDTREVLLDFQTKNANLRVASIENQTPPGKKAALTTGIAAASYENILLTDADCQPAGAGWINYMQAALGGDTEIGLGYSPYEKAPGWLNRFIRYESQYTAIQYLSFALAGQPYMGVGRNLIYRKGLFRRVGGFQKHASLASGDDDLFINEAASKANTTIVLNPEAWVFSLPKTSWQAYYNQKQRHLTTGTHYRPVHQLWLGTLALSHFAHYALGGILMFFPGMVWMALASYLVRMGVVWTLHVIISRKLNDHDLGRWTPVLDAMYVLYYLLFTPALITGKRDLWK